MRRAFVEALLALLTASALAGASPGSAADRISRIEVQGTSFRVHLSSGRVLTGNDLVGATLSLTQPGGADLLKVKVLAVQTDAYDPGHEIELYHMLSVDDAGQTQELCRADIHGEFWAFPIAGQWDTEGRRYSNKGYTLACGGDALGKCVRFGYKPWKTLPNGTRLAPYHSACVRLVRADYCGGHGTTRDGMLIDIYDKIGIQDPDRQGDKEAGAKFEAAWSPDGAICVAHTRVPENATLEQLAKDCPRLKGKLGDAACPSESVGGRGKPALLWNSSR